jgi:Fur family ferric uptake transcriptional regulator
MDTPTFDSPKNAFLWEQVKKTLSDLGQEVQPEELTIIREFCRHDGHMSAEEIKNRASASESEISETQVKRVLKMLCELGIAHRLTLSDRIVYEHNHLHQHHDHMICAKCGKILEFENQHIEEEQLSACRKSGFIPLMHRLEIHGICAECSQDMPTTRTLASCLTGETVEVVQIVGCPSMSHKLMSMGFIRGAQVRILASGGPVTVDLRNSRVALGRGQAARIIVRSPDQAGNTA